MQTLYLNYLDDIMKTAFNASTKLWNENLFQHFFQDTTSFLLLSFKGTQNLEPQYLLNLLQFNWPYFPNYWLFSHYLKKPKPHKKNNFQITKFTVAVYVVQTSKWRIPAAIFWTVSFLFFHADDTHSCILWIFTPNSVHWRIFIIP